MQTLVEKEQSSWFLALIGPVSLALLANAGQIKGNPSLAWIPVDLTLIVTALVFASILASRFNQGPAIGYVALPVILWVAYLPAIGLSHFDSYGLSKILTLFSVSLLTALAPFYLLRTQKQRLQFQYSLAALAGLISVSALFLTPTAANDFNNRLIFAGSNTIGTARVAMFGAIILAILLVVGELKLRLRILFAVGIAVSVALGVMTGSAGPVMSALFTLILTALVASSFRGRRLYAIVGMSAIGIGAMVFTSAQDSDGMERIADTLSGEATTSIGARIELWKDTLHQLPTHPFGVGWGMYSSEYLDHRYPHNLFLEVGIEAGWLPMFLLAIVVIATFIRGIRSATEPAMTVFFSLFVFSLLNSMVSSDVNGTRLLWITMFAIWADSRVRRAKGSVLEPES